MTDQQITIEQAAKVELGPTGKPAASVRERAVRVTIDPRTGKPTAPKKLTYSVKQRIVDGSDGRTYIAELTMYGHISFMRGDMKYHAGSVHPEDPRYAEVKALFEEQAAETAHEGRLLAHCKATGLIALALFAFAASASAQYFEHPVERAMRECAAGTAPASVCETIRLAEAACDGPVSVATFACIADQIARRKVEVTPQGVTILRGGQ